MSYVGIARGAITEGVNFLGDNCQRDNYPGGINFTQMYSI